MPADGDLSSRLTVHHRLSHLPFLSLRVPSCKWQLTSNPRAEVAPSTAHVSQVGTQREMGGATDAMSPVWGQPLLSSSTQHL